MRYKTINLKLKNAKHPGVVASDNDASIVAKDGDNTEIGGQQEGDEQLPSISNLVAEYSARSAEDAVIDCAAE